MIERRLGVDIGGTSIKWVALSAGGSVEASGAVPTPMTGPADVVAAVAGIAAAQPDAVSAIGVAVPGHVDRASGTTTLVPNIAGDWSGFPFAHGLRDRFGIDSELVNDARAFGIAELAVGSARGAERAVFATIGTGIGGAVAFDGRVLRNGRDSLGEVGHTTVVRGGDACGCGNRGCAEAYTGVRAMTRRYFGATSPTPGRRTGEGASDDASLRMSQLREAFDAGNPRAVEVVDTATWAVATAISSVCIVLGAPVVVLGGGLGIRWPEFAARVRAVLASRANLLPAASVHISDLGDTAGAIGAALSTSLAPLERRS